MMHDGGPVGLDGVQVCFDNQRAVSDAGVVLAAKLEQRLGIEALIERAVVLHIQHHVLRSRPQHQ